VSKIKTPKDVVSNGFIRISHVSLPAPQMIRYGATTGRTGFKKKRGEFDPRIIANKNSPLNPYTIDFFLPVDLPSKELEGRTDRKSMKS
jgi:hypothetical protein